MSRGSLSVDAGRRWLDYDSQLWQRALIVTAALATSAGLAPRASERYLIAMLAVGAVVVFLRWAPLGLAALIGASLVVPLSVNTGTNTSLNAPALLVPLLVALWLVGMLGRRDVRVLPSRPILPMLAFAAVASLAFMVGNLPLMAFAQTAPMAARIGGLAIFLLSVGAMLLMGHQVREVRWLQNLTWLFLVLAALYIAGRLLPGAGQITSPMFQRGADGSLFWVWVVALAASQAALNRQLRPPWRIALAGLVLATMYAGLVQNREWTSGWLPAAVALVVTLWVGMPRLRPILLLGGGAMAALSLPTIVGLVMGSNEYSLMTRLEAWRVMGEIIKISPIIGLGPANYYWYTPLFSILGYHVNFNSHNNYIDIVAQTGLLGMVCFLWLSWELWQLGWRLRTRLASAFGQAYAYGALGGLAGTLAAGMLGDWVLPFVYNVGLTGFRASVLGWIFLGGLIALEHIGDGKDSSPAHAAGQGDLRMLHSTARGK